MGVSISVLAILYSFKFLADGIFFSLFTQKHMVYEVLCFVDFWNLVLRFSNMW